MGKEKGKKNMFDLYAEDGNDTKTPVKKYNSDLTSAKDGYDSGAPVVLQSSLSFLNLLQTPVMTMMLIKIRMVVVVMTKNLVNKILEGEHLDLWPRFQL